MTSKTNGAVALVICQAVSMANQRTPPSLRAVAFGKRIIAAREQKGYSQEALAAMLKVTRGAVGQYELGLSTPRASKMAHLAEVLGVTVGWLLTGDDPAEADRAQTVSEKEALHLLRQLSADQQAAALAMLEGLVGKLPKGTPKR